jgi:hypothetical protein
MSCLLRLGRRLHARFLGPELIASGEPAPPSNDVALDETCLEVSPRTDFSELRGPLLKVRATCLPWAAGATLPRPRPLTKPES